MLSVKEVHDTPNTSHLELVHPWGRHTGHKVCKGLCRLVFVDTGRKALSTCMPGVNLCVTVLEPWTASAPVEGTEARRTEKQDGR